MDRIFLDIEIATTIDSAKGRGWDDTHNLELAVACIYEPIPQRYSVYQGSRIEDLRKRILAAQEVVTFNGWKFDLPTIWRCKLRSLEEDAALHAHLSKTAKPFDLLRQVWTAAGADPDAPFGDQHKGWGLDAIAKGTLGQGKTGSGSQAPIWWQDGRHDEVINYCLEDVRILYRLWAHAVEEGLPLVRVPDGKRVTIPR